MKKKILKWFIGLAALGATYFYLFVFIVGYLSLPREEGSISLRGLTGKVEIRRDSFGIPLIQAANEEDMFFGNGYAAASDRLWQMNIFRLLAQGRLSEVAGNEAIGIDVFMRSLGVKKKVDEILKTMPPAYTKALIAYSSGVNAFVENQSVLPIEFALTGADFEPWSPADCGYVYAILALGLSLNLHEELFFLEAAEKLGPEKAAWLVPVYPDEPIPFAEAAKFKEYRNEEQAFLNPRLHNVLRKLNRYFPNGRPASNNWVVAPYKTAKRKALLANDTHLPISMPSIWMLMHSQSPTYNAAGVTVPGVPYIMLGYNGFIGWGATMVEADSMDLFVEKLREKAGNLEYLYNGQWYPVKTRKETFRIRWGKPRTITVHETIHGPLLDAAIRQIETNKGIPMIPHGQSSGYATALRWTTQDGDRSGIGIYHMGKAKTMTEFRQALSFLDGSYLNIVFSDGINIAWQATGRYPLRRTGTGQLPSPGTTSRYDWYGYAAFAQQPFRWNPAEGFLATANERVAGKYFPLHISSSQYAPERADRIREILLARNNFTSDDMSQMQMDTKSLLGLKVKDIVLNSPLHEQIERTIATLASPDEKMVAWKAINLLKKFDGEMNSTSAEAALVGSFFHFLSIDLFGDELGSEDETTLWKTFLEINTRSYNAVHDHILQRDDSPFWDDVHTEEKESKADIFVRSLIHAYRFCEDEMDEESSWQWGRIHTISWVSDLAKDIFPVRGIFNRGPFPHEGSNHTLNVGHYSWGKNLDTFAIPAMRLLIDFSAEEPMQLITHSGQSGNPFSEHYDDMIPLFLTGHNHRVPFRKKNIDSQYQKILILTPEEKNARSQAH